MSILLDRLTKHINNATRDPEAEKADKEERAKVKELITKLNCKWVYKTEKERLVVSKKKSELDIDEINKLIELNEERKTLLDNAINYTEEEFKEKWESMSEKYDLLNRLAYSVRVPLNQYIKGIKQLLHDNPKLKSEKKTLIIDLEKDIRKILDDNKETDSNEIYKTEIDSLINKYRSKIEKDDELVSLGRKTYDKLVKNNFRLDFQENGGEPVPDEILKNKEVEEEADAEAERDKFSLSRFFSKMIGYAITIFIIILILSVLSIGASFAVNLNVYKPAPYKILYAIYGSLFSFIVIPYTLLYRWAYLGKKPTFYGFIPIIPRFFIYKPTQFLLGWLTYKPDEKIWDLQEWRKPSLKG
jgi:hypothetical protein